MIKSLFIIYGKSGVGKTTLINELCRRCNFETISSYTTRPIREGCISENHIFVSEDEFNAISNKALTFIFSGYHYCITYSQLNSADIFGLPPNAILGLYKKNNIISRPINLIYVKASDQMRYDRMIKRGNKPEWIKNRMVEEQPVFKAVEGYANKIIYNDDFNKCVEELER